MSVWQKIHYFTEQLVLHEWCRTNPIIFRTNPVIFRKNPVLFRANPVIFFAKMLFCSLKNALPYSLAKYSPKKCSSWKEHFVRRAFWQRILESIFERPREHSLKNALLHTFDGPKSNSFIQELTYQGHFSDYGHKSNSFKIELCRLFCHDPMPKIPLLPVGTLW